MREVITVVLLVANIGFWVFIARNYSIMRIVKTTYMVELGDTKEQYLNRPHVRSTIRYGRVTISFALISLFALIWFLVS